jgi:non-ribosomal peptide synthetase component F
MSRPLQDRITDMFTNTCLHQLFERQVESVPAAQSAVICEDEQITYHELNCRANQLARHLRALGAGPILVSLFRKRSANYITLLSLPGTNVQSDMGSENHARRV